ncbi:MAG: lipase maturation factor family protein [Myxococcota bacterium]|nr:lipase maturation factor family protein [Myxococcota bacterium]
MKNRSTYWLARFLFLRVLGLVYFVAFAGLAAQVLPLIGSEGLLPAESWLEWVDGRTGGGWESMRRLPTIFHLAISDPLLQGLALVGTVLSLLLLFGFANVPLLATLWALYFSFVSIGQRWFEFGWESQLLETGLLAVFLVPLFDPRPLPRRSPPPRVIVWLGWWLLARIMLGSALIKLRGAPCWTELSCLDYHFETQPVPGPLSRWFHELPQAVLHFGVLVNHLVELVLPFGLLGPRRLRHVAALGMALFQIVLILSGNLAFLNWLTLLVCLLCFDDRLLAWLLPERIARLARLRIKQAPALVPVRRVVLAAYAALVLVLSVPVVTNLVSSDQAMNTSFQVLRIVNTYGAFGSVGETRWEVVLEGTRDELAGAEAEWREYEFKCKPGSLDRRPCLITPYHDRLDWLAWFAGIEAGRGEGVRREPWLLHLIWKLLHQDAGSLSLLAGNPFPEGPPKHIRVRRYRYSFADSAGGNGLWWEREDAGLHLPPLSVEHPGFRDVLVTEGWLEE